MIDVDRFSSMRGPEGLEESALEFATKLSDVLARVFPNDHHLSHLYKVSRWPGPGG